VLIPHSLYQPGETLVHRLHPLTKLVYSLAAAAIIFGGPGMWLSAILPGLLAILLLWRAGLTGRAVIMVLRLLAPLTLVLFLVHGLFNPQNQTILIQLGPFFVGQEGLAFAALIVVRLIAVLVSSLSFVMTTHPAHLVQALEEAGLPRRLAYLLGSPLLIMPQLAGRVQAIQAAQQARGLETQGNLLMRIRALFPLVAPFIFSALVDVEERSLALEVRGFSASTPKTSLFELPDTPAQHTARWVMFLLAAFLLAAGFWWRANGGH
jgi:energy-coupling factor transport system permease protein